MAKRGNSRRPQKRGWRGGLRRLERALGNPSESLNESIGGPRLQNPFSGHGMRGLAVGELSDFAGGPVPYPGMMGIASNPFSGHGYRGVAVGESSDFQGGPVDYPGRMGILQNPGTPWFWLAVGAAALYTVWKKPNLPGSWDDNLWADAAPGTPIAGSNDTPATADAPGFSDFQIVAA